MVFKIDLDKYVGASKINPMKKVALNSILLGSLLICFTIVFFLNALLQLRKTERILFKVYESQAKNLINQIELLAQEMVKDFLYIHKGLQNPKETADIDLAFRIKENILESLYNILWEVSKKENLDLTSLEAQELLRQNRLAAMVIWNEGGQPVTQIGNISEANLSYWTDHLREEQGELFLGTHEEQGYYLMAMRVPKERYWLGLFLDPPGMRYWATKEALRLAIWEVGLIGIRYVMVGTGDKILAQLGELPEAHDASVLEVSSSSSLDPKVSIKVGLDIGEILRLSSHNRTAVLTMTLAMALVSVGLALLFYTIQQRHLKKLEDMKEALRNEERLSSLGRLAKGLAHEIKNPLNAINMVAQRLALEFAPPEEVKNQEFRELISLVRSEVARLKDLVDSFIGPSKKTTDFREGDLIELLDGLIKLIQEEARSKDLNITLSYDRRPLMVRMDYSRLYQAFLNILKNSLESLSKGGHIQVSSKVERNREVKVSIKDTGGGIPKEDLAKIFEIGYTTKEKGLGLGLPIAREIILAHGGQIKVESTLGVGTIFTVTLPLVG